MTIRFHGKLYPVEAVKAAVEAFAEIASIRTTRTATGTEVEIEPVCPEDEAEVAGEFANYVLGQAVLLRGRA
jgi:hypothetical protein